MKRFSPKLFSCLRTYSKRQLVSDLVAGVIVAIIALPLSIALAIASGVSPERGLYTAIVAGFVIAFFGGSRVNISGPTAAFAVIVAGVVAQHGVAGLALATVMAGLLLVLMGIFRLGSLIQYIPYTITTGFTSGIALTIVIGQIKDFIGLTFDPSLPTVETLHKVAAIGKSIGTFNWQALLVGLVCLGVLIVFPKFVKKVPASLVAVLVGILMVKIFSMDVLTIGDLYSIRSGLPPFSLPTLSFDAIVTLLPSAVTIAVLAAIESLLSCVVSDGMIDDKHDSNTELVAQGLGNFCSGLFGGIPATGAIARTAANVKNGGRTPISGMVHAVVLLLVLLVLMPYAAWIPMPTIAAVLFIVAYNMCEWRRFVKICKTAPLSDILVLVLTFVLTVVFDLVVAIEFGLLLALILFVKKMADTTRVRAWSAADEMAEQALGMPVPDHVAVFSVSGPMFFADSHKFAHFPLQEGDRVMVVEMSSVPSMDISALQSLKAVRDTCARQGVALFLVGVADQPLTLMQKSGLLDGEDGASVYGKLEEALSAASARLNP